MPQYRRVKEISKWIGSRRFKVRLAVRVRVFAFLAVGFALILAFPNAQLWLHQVSIANAQAGSYVLHGLDFSPYIDGQDPNINPQVTEAQVQARMQIIAPSTKWVRSFSSTNGLENVPSVARLFGLKVAANAWISNDAAASANEVANLIAAAKAGLVDLAIVGSENLQRGDVPKSQLLSYIQQVRQAIPPSIPVTTADTYGMLLANPDVVAAVDVVFANIYPYWEGVAASNATCAVAANYQSLVTAAGGKPVIISEAGWPSDGSANGAAIASSSNASLFFSQFISWARANQISYFYFDALDESWKSNLEPPAGANSPGPHWGIWDKSGSLKSGMQPVFDGQTVAISCNGLIDGPGTPGIAFTFVPPYGSFLALEGKASHVDSTANSVAVYIKVFGGWWNKPTNASPLTIVQQSGDWTSSITTGGSDQFATDIAAFLIPNTYIPPQLGGQTTLPPPLYQISLANVQVTRSLNSISGTVVDAQSNPVSGVIVSVTGTNVAQTTSAADGRYSLPTVSGLGPDTVTPSGLRYIFSPTTETIAALSGAMTANFTATSVPIPVATFLRNDSATQGNWISTYGSNGSAIAGYMPNAQVTISGQSAYSWAAPTNDVRALQTPGTGRTASAYYSSTSFDIDVVFGDGLPHTVALYCLDWDSSGRVESVDVLDAFNGNVIDTRTLASFVSGQYLVWYISGHVTFRVRRNSGPDAVISGVFLDPGPGARASFLKIDKVTLGTWKGLYGSDGAAIAGDTSNIPSYSQVLFTNESTETFQFTSGDINGLQKLAHGDRVAAAWANATTFSIDVNLTDGKPHQIALNCTFWGAQRQETIDVLEAGTGSVLNSQSVDPYDGGYYVWAVSGHVTFRITRKSGADAVVSGLFFDPILAATATFTTTDASTQGNWQGPYGDLWYSIANSGGGGYIMAVVGVTPDTPTTWSVSTADTRALQTPNGRIASRFSDPNSITLDVNLTDGLLHPFAVYCLDWDSAGRTETIDAIDAFTGNVLDSRTLSGFTNGVYLVWSLRGHAIFKVARAAGPDAVVSGIFIGSGQPSLVQSKSHNNDFNQGQHNVVYTVGVMNRMGTGSTAGTVTVSEVVPVGLSLVSMMGDGWACNGASCTRGDSLVADLSYPAITVTLNVANDAPSSVTNQVTVSGIGFAPANASDLTSIHAFTCDLNGDGHVDVADVQTIINEALGTIPASHDLNHDGVVTVADVQKEINAALSLGCPY